MDVIRASTSFSAPGGLVLPVLVSFAMVLGCAPDAPVAHLPGAASPIEANTRRAAVDPGPHYSPWVVTLESRDPAHGGPFDEISFKDVGLSSFAPEERPETFEAIAQSLASQLGGDTALPLQSEATYSEAMSRPENHLSCAPRHVYVDLWEAEDPARWGYSLWSGCGEDDRFAWEELSRTSDPHGGEAIARLTRHIAGSLREAMQSGCFSRRC
ncbi:MAG: hypothetical protein AB8I08_00895 [Sandaracinaceae bacterium]